MHSRKQVVQINRDRSSEFVLEYGVPQGSVLGPVIFTMYTQPLSEVFIRNNMSYHFFADDTQLYKFDILSNIPSLLASVEVCLGEVKCWMETNKLKLNDEKTEAMLCSRNGNASVDVQSISLNVNGCPIQPSADARNLGVFLDQDFSMALQIDNLCRTLRNNLKKIATIRDYLTKDVTSMLVTTLVLSRLDYCNSLLVNISQDKISRLQVIQNSAAKLVVREKRMSHSLPILYELHWLPVKERIGFKIAMLCFKCLNDEAPMYLKDMLEVYVPSRALRSASDRTKLVSRNNYNYRFYGGRSFTHIGPLIWNKLPKSIREANSIESFKSRLKHFLFTVTFL